MTIAAVLLFWAVLVHPPARVVRSTLLLGLALFLPYFLLVPLIHAPASDSNWWNALAVPWNVFFRGMTAMQASVYTATALSASALRQGLTHLPVPRVVSAVLIQILHQTGNLIHETHQVASAVAVRGGTSGYRTSIRILGSLPRVWLPRVVERAERVGAAMELRGYCERDLALAGGSASSWKDLLVILVALATVAGVTALRLRGGA